MGANWYGLDKQFKKTLSTKLDLYNKPENVDKISLLKKNL
jgi:hypothetical protein